MELKQLGKIFNPLRVWREKRDRDEQERISAHQRELEIIQLRLKNDLEQKELLNDTLKFLTDQSLKSQMILKDLTMEMAKNVEKSSEVLQTWLEGFKVTELPFSSVKSEEDDYREYQDRVEKMEQEILSHSNMIVPPELRLAHQLRLEETKD